MNRAIESCHKKYHEDWCACHLGGEVHLSKEKIELAERYLKLLNMPGLS